MLDLHQVVTRFVTLTNYVIEQEWLIPVSRTVLGLFEKCWTSIGGLQCLLLYLILSLNKTGEDNCCVAYFDSLSGWSKYAFFVFFT